MLQIASQQRRQVTTKAGGVVEIGPLLEAEREPLWEIFSEVVAAGDSYPDEAPLRESDFERSWLHVDTVVAARTGTELVGAYYLKPNHPGRARHIANAGYVVARARRGRGVGRALVLDSIQRAPSLGFDAIQFNLVFATNPARRLYEELGWQVIGTIPSAVDSIDAVIYLRSLGDVTGPDAVSSGRHGA